MSRYEILLFLHVAAAIVWVGAGTLVTYFEVRAARADDAAAMHRVVADVEWLTGRLFIPSSLAVLVFGLALVFDGPWSFDQLWIVLGIAGYAFSFLVGILYFAPESGRIAKLVETHGPEHPAITARIQRIFAVGHFELAILFAVVLDMSVKPTADSVGFHLVAAGLVLAGGAFAAWTYRRPTAGAVADLP